MSEKIRELDASRYTINCINGVLAVIDDLRADMAGKESGDVNQAMSDAGETMAKITSMPRIGEYTAESFAYVDIAGYNYMDSRYVADKETYPNRIICGSETFPANIDRNWRQVLDNPHVIGDYTWTGWDYLGEAGIGGVRYDADEGVYSGWPWLAAWCGDFDLTGERRPASYYREIVFGLRKEPYVAVQRPLYYGKKANYSPWSWSDSVSGWTWEGYEGKPVMVEVYANADEVVLLRNGQEVGRALCGEAQRYKAIFDTVYEPGQLVAVAYSNGEEQGRYTLNTAVGEALLRIEPECDEVDTDNGDLVYIGVLVTDAQGTVFHDRQVDISISVEGAGILKGFGSADPVSQRNYRDTVSTTYNGRLLAIIRPTETGTIHIEARVQGMPPVTASILSVAKGTAEQFSAL